jgi:hypothetical protein
VVEVPPPELERCEEPCKYLSEQQQKYLSEMNSSQTKSVGLNIQIDTGQSEQESHFENKNQDNMDLEEVINPQSLVEESKTEEFPPESQEYDTPEKLSKESENIVSTAKRLDLDPILEESKDTLEHQEDIVGRWDPYPYNFLNLLSIIYPYYPHNLLRGPNHKKYPKIP